MHARFHSAWLLVLLVTACGSTGARANEMSFAQMQAINAGVAGEWLLAEYPFARNVGRHPGGAVSQMSYTVRDPDNHTYSLQLNFDPQGVLQQKRYAGPFVRPPVDVDAEGQPVAR